MHAVHVVARVALGLVFVVAGASKIASGRAWPAQALQLRVPRAIALAVPWIELVVGALVVVGVGEPFPAIGAWLLLIVFTSLSVRTLRAGRHPPCACFGSWSAKPLGWRHVCRNAAFIALALLVMLTS